MIILIDNLRFKIDITRGETEMMNPFTLHKLLDRCSIKFDSSIPFITFTFHTKTHLLSNDIKSLSPKQKLIHRIIFKLKSQGYDFKQISDTLNKHNIRTTTGKKFYRNLVWNIYEKRLKRNEFMSQPIVKEYRDFDIIFYKVKSDLDFI